MKTFRLIGMALIAMTLSFNLSSCDDDDDDNFIEVDYSKDLVGTWTLLEPGLAVGMEIEADGSVIATTLVDGEYNEDVPGKIEVENNKVCLTLEDGTIFKGLLEIIPGETFVIVDEESGMRLTHRLCEQDLSEEILGQWVSVNASSNTNDDMLIYNYKEDGTVIRTGFSYELNDFFLNKEASYKVIGDLIITKRAEDSDTTFPYVPAKLTYSPDGTAYGDIMTTTLIAPVGDEFITASVPFLRVKQHLELPGQKYDFIKTYVSNVSGKDEDVNVDGVNFNFSKLDGTLLDKMLKALLFTVEFPSADTIKYSYTYNGEIVSASAPIEVEGNKMTVKMDKTRGCFRDMDLYTFQDKDNSQMHIYMPKHAFINYFGNIAVSLLAEKGDIDANNQAEVDAVFDELTELITTINVSFVMTKSK